VAVVACLVLLVLDRRRVPLPEPAADPRRRIPTAVAVAGLGVGFALVGGIAAGAAAALAAVAAALGPAWLRRWLPLAPAVLMAGVAAYVVAKTIRYPIPADVNWPAAFAAVDPLAWSAVAVTIALVVAPQCGAVPSGNGIVERQRVGGEADEDTEPRRR
jgi:hypothetical protein